MLNAAIYGVGKWGQTLVRSVQGKSRKIRFVTGVARSLDKYRNFARETDLTLTDGGRTRHSINWCTEGSSWAVTINSTRMTIATVSKGPNMIANTGAISIPDPTPTNPRMKPATIATQVATKNPAFPTISISPGKFILALSYLVDLKNIDPSCGLTTKLSCGQTAKWFGRQLQGVC